MPVTLRPARPEDGERLCEIAIAAKSHWGYEEEAVRSWAAQGDFSPVGLAAKIFLVADEEARAVGFASLKILPPAQRLSSQKSEVRSQKTAYTLTSDF